jgi:hypothetical protein
MDAHQQMRTVAFPAKFDLSKLTGEDALSDIGWGHSQQDADFRWQN